MCVLLVIDNSAIWDEQLTEFYFNNIMNIKEEFMRKYLTLKPIEKRIQSADDFLFFLSITDSSSYKRI